jgi:hypothetical protein
MDDAAGGYFNPGDEYPKSQVSKSNEREMIYLNANYIENPLADSFLAHEFMHLITFNYKERLHNTEEETWLNEARAEYAPTLVGYDAEYEGSNLQRRVNIFLKNPTDSITEWKGTPDDYGALNLFTQYLVEKYGIDILVDSLKSKETGIASLNEALKKRGFEKDFSDIFTDWTIAILVNDCNLAEEYCYKNGGLKSLRITPSINFLPLKGKSTLGVTQSTKNWAGNWFKFIGSKGTIRIEFIGNPENLFVIPYVAKDFYGNNSLGFFELSEFQRGEILVDDFGTELNSLTIIPSIQSKVSGFEETESSIPFFWEVSTIEKKEEKQELPQNNLVEKPIVEMTKDELLIKISEIEDLLTQLKNQLVVVEEREKDIVKDIEDKEKEEKPSIVCNAFSRDLFFGMKNDDDVKCLQQFLVAQGSSVYPEALVTGNFLTLTRNAVVRFQEKYIKDILSPFGLNRGTGYVGEMTRGKINELLKN